MMTHEVKTETDMIHIEARQEERTVGEQVREAVREVAQVLQDTGVQQPITINLTVNYCSGGGAFINNGGTVDDSYHNNYGNYDVSEKVAELLRKAAQQPKSNPSAGWIRQLFFTH